MIDFLLKVCGDLERIEIPYMLGGSMAMNFHSIPRITMDMDIVIDLQLEDVKKFMALFPEAYCYEPSIVDEIKRKGCFNVIDWKTGYKIDFFIRKQDAYTDMAFKRRKRVDKEVVPIWVLSIEDLILAKLLWIQPIYSDRQVQDIENLLLNPDIDKAYLKEWIEKLRIKTYNISIL